MVGLSDGEGSPHLQLEHVRLGFDLFDRMASRWRAPARSITHEPGLPNPEGLKLNLTHSSRWLRLGEKKKAGSSAADLGAGTAPKLHLIDRNDLRRTSRPALIPAAGAIRSWKSNCAPTRLTIAATYFSLTTSRTSPIVSPHSPGRASREGKSL